MACSGPSGAGLLELHRSRFHWTPDRQVTTMPVMNDEENQASSVEDHRSESRWSANKKLNAVLRLLRGEPLDQCRVEHLAVRAGHVQLWGAT